MKSAQFVLIKNNSRSPPKSCKIQYKYSFKALIFLEGELGNALRKFREVLRQKFVADFRWRSEARPSLPEKFDLGAAADQKGLRGSREGSFLLCPA